MLSTLVMILLLASVALGALDSSLITREITLALAPSSLVKRAPNTSALATIISLAGASPSCSTPCAQFTADLFNCAKGASQSLIASCACSTTTLGDSRACASCISLESNTSPANATAVVTAYNSFVDLCSADGLASVTGTVVAGASTAAATRTPAAAPAASGRSTYSLSSLSFTGVGASLALASSTASAASLATTARLNAATNLPTNGASGLQVGAALGAVFAIALLV